MLDPASSAIAELMYPTRFSSIINLVLATNDTVEPSRRVTPVVDGARIACKRCRTYIFLCDLRVVDRRRQQPGVSFRLPPSVLHLSFEVSLCGYACEIELLLAPTAQPTFYSSPPKPVVY